VIDVATSWEFHCMFTRLLSRRIDDVSRAVTKRDVRCAMLNLNPDTARPAPEMMKAVVRANQNNAGINLHLWIAICILLYGRRTRS
jgi:hypothetical protein